MREESSSYLWAAALKKADPVFWYAIGFILLALSIIPTLQLQGNAAVNIHDQLDGEVLAYTLQARHLFDKNIPEFMSGINNKASLTVPSNGTLLIYLFLKPEQAYVLNEVLVQIAAFVGMLLLLREFGVKPWIVAFVSITFSLLPFYTVYGLSVMGQPLFFYAVIQAYKGKKGVPYLIIAGFAFCSSLVLVGYADCIILTLIMLICIIRRKKVEAKRMAIALACLAFVYLICFFPLVSQTVFGNGFISHKEEYVASSSGEWQKIFSDIWKNGLYHSVSNHQIFTWWVVGACLMSLLFLPLLNDSQIRITEILVTTLLSSLAIAAFYALWHSYRGTSVRNSLRGVFISFQADRFYWLYPVIWYIGLGAAFQMISSCGSVEGRKGKNIIARVIAYALCAYLIINVGQNVWENSRAKENDRRAHQGVDSMAVSFNNFYSESLFQEIDRYIGKPKETYRVGSVALYPSVPLYNGFYCIDGYSNNYDVKYKHAFREIIQGELEKNQTLKDYFDNWGNRCYLLCSDTGQSYYFTKNVDKSISITLNSEALNEMNCQYILSGLEIVNPNDSGLQLLQIFEEEDSPYRIWVYGISI